MRTFYIIRVLFTGYGTTGLVLLILTTAMYGFNGAGFNKASFFEHTFLVSYCSVTVTITFALAELKLLGPRLFLHKIEYNSNFTGLFIF